MVEKPRQEALLKTNTGDPRTKMKVALMGKNVKCSNSKEGLQQNQHHRPIGT